MKLKFSLRQKVVIGILALAAVLTAVAAGISYGAYSEAINTHYEKLAVNVSGTAANLLDTGMIRSLTDQVKERYLTDPGPEFDTEEQWKEYLDSYNDLKDADYETMYHVLERVKMASNVLSLYVVYFDQESKTCVYIVDADDSETACPTGTWDIVYEQNFEALEHPEEGFAPYITNTEEFGWLVSAGSPIFDEDGSVIAHAMTDISMDKVMNQRHDYLMKLLGVLLAVTWVLIFVAIRVVNHAVVRPVNTLAQAASAYVEEKEKDGEASGKSILEKLEIHTGDEVENLYHSFRQMERDINEYIENLTFVTAEKEKIGAELSVATEIQASMLPSIFPAFPDRDEFDIYASMKPAREVGGDFYDFFLIDEDHLALVMADVSGKGVPAALFMVIAKTLLKNRSLMGASPKEILETVNNQLCENNEAEMFVTVWLGILEISTGKLTAANAGHEYPAIRRKNGMFELFRDRHGFVLAGMENVKYREYELDLREGDTLFVYTDGVPEATNLQEELYGTDRMIRALNQKPDGTPQELLQTVNEDVFRFAGEAPQFDDITMLAIKISLQIKSQG